MPDTDSYFYNRIFTEIGATPQDIKIQVCRTFEGERRTFDIDIFQEDDKGNIKILVYTLDRQLIIYDNHRATPEKPNINNAREETFFVTRLKTPQTITTKEGETEIKKYHMPKGTGTFPFFPPALVKKFEAKEQIKTLVLTEGYFKSFAGSLHGLDIVGLSSITHYKQKDTQAMYTDVLRLIKTCNPENIILLYDGDCRSISHNAIEKEKDLYTRPSGFISSATAIRDLLTDLDKNIYFAHINTEEITGNPKGLDDLLTLQRGKEPDTIADLLSISSPGIYFKKVNITSNAKRLNSYFYLNSVNAFYEQHQEFIKGREFIYHGTRFRYNENTSEVDIVIPKAAKQYFRVGDQYYEFVHVPNKYKQLEKTFQRRLKTTIIDDHGQNFVKHIPKYKAFCNVPDHTNYVQIMNNCFNMYTEFEHEPDPGETCPVTLRFMRHIFGRHYRLGMDYVQLLYQKPVQILPILCLVSKENNTGKSTFIKLLKAIFTSNCAVVGNEELTNSFNAFWSSKLIVACEESFIEKQTVMEKIKALNTADKITMNSKGKDQVEIDFYAKFILCSNNEQNFIIAGENDIRYWVIKVPVPIHDNPDLLQSMIDEIPAFLAYLNKRKMKTKRESRMWFKSSFLRTEALRALIDSNRPKVEREIISHVKDYFLEFNIDELLLDTRTINTEFFRGRYDNTYLNKILRERMKLDQWKNADGQYAVKQFLVPRWQSGPDGNFIRSEEKRIGRPWVFLRQHFVTKTENVVPDTETTPF